MVLSNGNGETNGASTTNGVPSSSKKVNAIISEISRVGGDVSQDVAGAREKLLDLAFSLQAAVETPGESVQRIGWAEPARQAAVQIGVDLKVFEKLAEKQGGSCSCDELAKACGAEAALLSRLLKHMVAMNVIDEIQPGRYTSTALSDALVLPKYGDGVSYNFELVSYAFQHLPFYFKEVGYKTPSNPYDGPFQYAIKEKKAFWEVVSGQASYKGYPDKFNNYMSGYRQGKTSWMDPVFYPVQERLRDGVKADGADGENVLLVDVGGGLGHDLEEFHSKHPDMPGRLVLQDRPEVIDTITNLSTAIEPKVHDFFTPQPIKGAKAYFMHSVLHDWDDNKALHILRELALAMKRGHSKVLIHEFCVPDFKAPWPPTCLDLCMLALGLGMERTQTQWENLIRLAGLKIVKIWTFEAGTESLIEAELAD